MDAQTYFAAKMRYETDPSDVHRMLEESADFVLVDTRSPQAWEQGHVRGAVHIPREDIPESASTHIPAGTLVIVYCWGPGCNGATKSAHEFARMGYQVKEMIGGFEYWAREGYPVDAREGDKTRNPDPLTAPIGADGHAFDCAC